MPLVVQSVSLPLACVSGLVVTVPTSNSNWHSGNAMGRLVIVVGKEASGSVPPFLALYACVNEYIYIYTYIYMYN